MSIRKHGRVYWLDIWCGKHRVRRSLHTDEYYLALDRARDITLELRQPKPAGVPFGEFADKYLAWSAETKPSSVRNERYYMAALKPWLKDRGLLTLEQITTQRVEEYRAHLATKKVGHTTKFVSHPTVNRHLAMLRTMFNKARDWGLVECANPVSRVKFYKENGKVRPLTEAEVGRVLDAAQAISAAKYTSPTGRAIYDICRVVLFTGLRRSEVLNMRWSDIIDDELRVRGKGGKVRTVPLNDEALQAIHRQPHEGAYVFAVPNRASCSLLRRTSAHVERMTGVHFGLHKLRHAFATRLLASGADIVTISQLLGHAASMTTLLYAHTSPRRMREAVNSISTGAEKG